MKSSTTLFAMLVMVLSLVAPSVTFAQLSEMDRTSVFPGDVVRFGAQVTLCHIPPGNPSGAQTIEVADAAVPAHLAHGDLMGECPYECDGPASPVPKTGQTVSFGPGDDGAHQAGVAVDPRFRDNGDGTVTDNLTGLVWLRNPNCFSHRNWGNALSAANGLADGSCGLTDGSVAGDWRLPNIKELQSLIDYGKWGPALPEGHPFSGALTVYFWSSSTYLNPDHAWFVFLWDGHVEPWNKTGTSYVWPVRGPE